MIRVMIVDDHSIVREGIRILLEKFPDIEVVADADNGRSALEVAGSASPGVVLMDTSMPGMNGIEATQRLGVECPSARVLILSMHKDKRFVAQAFRAGARGYLLKDCTSAELVHAVRAVAAGEIYVCSGIIGVVIDDYIKRIPDSFAQSEAALTPREREVLQLIAEGNNAKNIAFLLKINVKTVDTHRQQIMKKLKLYSIAELTKFAIREGVTSLEN
ncbi:response regulator transcription factor [Geomonas oryzisoli]|uniref:Response regulator transcription factor n=1 Tax=Geomonas oryzisoli TaxID=2847992 RepID=A0ABX8JCV2_9BACT|nr:response regulator transcription factor [Geomonas oryzisoli]QWV94509.1 response regulator transcription factor [Geomonas oryzisoli]